MDFICRKVLKKAEARNTEDWPDKNPLPNGRLLYYAYARWLKSPVIWGNGIILKFSLIMSNTSDIILVWSCLLGVRKLIQNNKPEHCTLSIDCLRADLTDGHSGYFMT